MVNVHKKVRKLGAYLLQTNDIGYFLASNAR